MSLLVSLILVALPASAGEAPGCSSPSSPQAILECVLRVHPAARSADALLKQSEALEAAAGQRPNPEAEGNAVFGKSAGEENSQIDLSVLHTFETAGKRSRRIDRARAESGLLKAEAAAAREELTVDTILSLYRLRQIRDELRLIKEALAAFSRIAAQLQGRPRRSPEQQVSLSVFRLAERDYSLRRAVLDSEDAALRRRFELGLGAGVPVTDAALPKRSERWPEPGAALTPAAFNGSAALRAEAAVAAAKADLGAAQAASYPDVRFGPSLQRQKSEGVAVTQLGLGFALPLPLYQRNAGGRLLALRAAETADARSAAAYAILAAERDVELTRYRAAISVLARADNQEEMEARHEELESLFERGIIASALVIEAHRQIVDYTRNLNEQELAAVRALWTIYVIEGRALTEKL